MLFRRKKVKTADGDNSNDNKDVNEETVALDESVDKTHKGNKLNKATSPERSKKNGAKGKTATSSTPNDEFSNPKKKQSSKVANSPAKKKTKTGLSASNNEENGNVESDDVIKRKDSLEKTPSGQSQPRSKKLKKKNAKQDDQNSAGGIDKINNEVKEKSLNKKQNIAKAKTTTSVRNSGVQRQNDKDGLGKDELVEEEKSLSDLKRSSAKANKNDHGKQTKIRGSSAKSVNASSGSSCELSTEKDTIPLGSRKRPKNSTISNGLSEKKIKVFDHLFSELKKCPGFSKLTVSSAAELLLKVNTDKLKVLVLGLSSKQAKTSVTSSRPTGGNVLSSPAKSPGSVSVSEPKRRRTNSEKTSSLSSTSSTPEKTGQGKSEQVKLSQAAEALVSFRTNPTILRQEKTDTDILSAKSSDKVISNTDSSAENTAPKESCMADEVAETWTEIVTTANEASVSRGTDSFDVSAPSQSQTASQMQSSLLVQGPLHQPVGFPASIEANLQHLANMQHNLVNLSQFTAHLNSVAASVPSQVSPRLPAPSSLNPSSTAVISPRMMNPTDIQNIQALFGRPAQPSSIQTPMVVQGVTPSLASNSNSPQAQPQQPLKGMEDVVSCVGSRTTGNLLWNLKPATPVVYLTSPQTLSGVRARNIIPQSEGHGTLPFTAGMANVQSVGIPKASLSSASTSVLTLGKVTLVSQPATLSTSHAVNGNSQRPILPREQRMTPMIPGESQSAPQAPVTTVMGQIPRNIPPAVRPGNMTVQFSNTAATSPLNSRQTPVSIVTQAPCVSTTVQSTATVSTAAGMAPVSAKLAVKMFVHERTKSAELKRTSSFNNLLSNEPIAATTAVDNQPENVVLNASSQSLASQLMDQAEKQTTTTKQSDFNLHQAASALLSISSQDGLDTADMLQAGGEGEDSLDEHDDEVVFTSKGVFRVGDVDVDPKYNRIGRGKSFFL